ncbi:3-methyl-2-oxobutanoate dehydrogenase subunit beta [Desulfuromonas carbonis]|uniref:thiamine pyrophosphate-dependent enzyme n=1 Tax=Desulfuromonas sp. DDH964 TaxID=1823759 RepID=UPI00078BE177|nr:thiamine pyrophosphate-dependent enzyme [Desulfuromonas sp. DDH964]AMV72060.1 2-oxoacid:ferredoxin oxidoreductase, thiamin diphosphate-binding subunit [Desulfuromonas sp. DDH964]
MTTAAKTNVLTLTDEELVHSGNRACSGCGLSVLYRIGIKALGRDCIFVVPPSCLTVMQGLYPIAASQLPILNGTFAATAAIATGVRAAMKRLGKATQVVAWAGDGGTSDIGIQALSGALERGEDIIYICYDNEAYMNTGVQRSGTTPQGGLTTTTPYAGKKEHGKNVPAIVAAHNPAYVATCSAAYPLDFHDKLLKAKQIRGLKYIHIQTPCPPGWGCEEHMTIKIGKAAVDCGLFDLFEIENGKKTLSEPSRRLLDKSKQHPVNDYLGMQVRFKALSAEQIVAVQQRVDQKWEEYRREFAAE